MSYKVYKYRLYPSEAQKRLFEMHFKASNFVFNWALKRRIDQYKLDKTFIKTIDLQKELIILKEEEKWLKLVNSQSLQAALRTLDKAYSRFFKKLSNFPKFKKNEFSATYICPQKNKIDLSKNKFYTINFREGIKTKFHRKFNGELKSCSIKFENEKYYLLASVKETTDQNIRTSNSIIGIDMGITYFATFSNGDKIKNPKFFYMHEKKIAFYQSKLSKMLRGSNNYKKLNHKISREYLKLHNKRSDFLHKLSNDITTRYSIICIEDLDLKKMGKNFKFGKSIYDLGWRSFIQMLEYKASQKGGKLLKCNKFDPTSKTCTCGVINKTLKLKQRTWVCKNCGKTHDRDILAANNIIKFALEHNS